MSVTKNVQQNAKGYLNKCAYSLILKGRFVIPHLVVIGNYFLNRIVATRRG